MIFLLNFLAFFTINIAVQFGFSHIISITLHSESDIFDTLNLLHPPTLLTFVIFIDKKIFIP